jgi:hypothetical protein
MLATEQFMCQLNEKAVFLGFYSEKRPFIGVGGGLKWWKNFHLKIFFSNENKKRVMYGFYLYFVIALCPWRLFTCYF